MSFINAVKRAFGFGTDEDLFDIDDNITQDVDIQIHTGEENAEDTSSETPTLAVSAEMKAKIYEGAVAVFNQALPDFLNRSVDPQTQQRILPNRSTNL